jgi:hypothetical protein
VGGDGHQGFMVLIAKEWIHYGHQFHRRSGHYNADHTDDQQSPCFLQVRRSSLCRLVLPRVT